MKIQNKSKSKGTSNNYLKQIKFRLFNKDQNFLFISINNSIKIYDTIILKPLETIYVEENIVEFEVCAKTSFLIVNTEKKLISYQASSKSDLSKYDFKLKVKFDLEKEVLNEQIVNLSVSILGDLISTCDKFGNVKLFNKDLDIVQSFRLSNSIADESQFYEYYQISYDTKNIVMGRFDYSQSKKTDSIENTYDPANSHKLILLLYKNIYYNPNEHSPNEIYNEDKPFLESDSSEILNDEGLSYMKEVQKGINEYLEHVHASVFLILTKKDSFLIVRKVFQDSNKPIMIVMSYLKLSSVCFSRLYSTHEDHLFSNINTNTNTSLGFGNKNDNENKPIDYNRINDNKQNENYNNKINGGVSNNNENEEERPTFSLLYNNENPLFTNQMKGSITDMLPSYLVNSEYWTAATSDSNLVFDEGNAYQSSRRIQNTSIDYILFNIKGKLQIYMIEGLSRSAYEEIELKPYKGFSTYGNFRVLRFVKTLENRHSVFFLDEHNLIRNFDVHKKFIEEEVALKIYTNIQSTEYNRKNRKLMILEYNQSHSIIVITNHILFLTKVIVIENQFISDLKWVDEDSENSNLSWGFASLISFICNNHICIINFRSSSLNHRINNLTFEDIKFSHFVVNVSSLIDTSNDHEETSLQSPSNFQQTNQLIEGYFIEVVSSFHDDSSNNTGNSYPQNEEKAKEDKSSEETVLNINLYISLNGILYKNKYLIINSSDNATQQSNQPESSILLEDLVQNSEFLYKKHKKSKVEYSLSYDIHDNKDIKISIKAVAFINQKIYFYIIDPLLNIVSVYEMIQNNEYETKNHRLIFDFLIQGRILHHGFYENAVLIVITDLFIESFNLKTSFYCRNKNLFLLDGIDNPTIDKQFTVINKRNNLSYLEDEEPKSNVKNVISSKKIGNFIFLMNISKKGIKFERIPKNKSLFEGFEIEFKASKEITTKTRFYSNCGVLVLNESQIELLEDIGKIVTSKELLYDDISSNSLYSNLQNLYLLNINPNSIFELETILDYYLDNNENMVKYILRLFFNLQNRLIENKFDISLVSTKGLPNFYSLSVSEIKNLLFNNNNIKTGNGNTITSSSFKLSDDVNDESFIKDLDFNKDIEDEYNKYIQSQTGLTVPNALRFMSITHENMILYNKMIEDAKEKEKHITSRETISNPFLPNTNQSNNFIFEKDDKANDDSPSQNRIQKKEQENDLFSLNQDISIQQQIALFYRIERHIAYQESISNVSSNDLLDKLRDKDEQLQQNLSQINNSSSYFTSKVTNLRHLINFYETLLNESTNKLDNITKYFLIKIKSKSLALDYSSFRLNSTDLCWLMLINDQEFILKFLLGEKKQMTFKVLQRFCIPLWIKNEYKLKEYLEISGKNEYNQSLSIEGNKDTLVRNLAENVALYFYLSGKFTLVLEKFDKEDQNSAVSKFLRKDFTQLKVQKQARENAYHLLTKKRYLIAIFMFLLGNDIKSALEVALDNLKSINIAICILKLYPSVCNYYDKSAFVKEKLSLYDKIFLKFGNFIRDPWLVVYQMMSLQRYDQVISYIQDYKEPLLHEKFNVSELKESLLFVSNDYETLNNVIDMQVFDYKLYFYLKEVEKIYNIKLSDQKKSQQSQSNTDFSDVWANFDDNDDDEEDYEYEGNGRVVCSNSNTNANINITSQSVISNQPKPSEVDVDVENYILKEVKQDYNNILIYSFSDLVNKGVLISPILTYIKLSSERNEVLMKQKSIRSLLSDLLYKRIILDTINLQSLKDNKELDKYLLNVDKIINYFSSLNLLNKNEAYMSMNLSYLKLEKYNFSIYGSYKSNNILSSIKIIEYEIESSIIFIIDETIKFNYNENIDLLKISSFLKNKIYPISYFLQKMLLLKNNTHHSDLTNEAKSKCERVLIMRVLFKIFAFLIGAAKSSYKFNKIREIYVQFSSFLDSYERLIDSPTELIQYIEKISYFSLSLSQKIKNIKPIQDHTTLLYIMILNLNIVNKIKSLLDLKAIEIQKAYKIYSIGHINEFKFVKRYTSLLYNFIKSFEMEYERLIKRHFDVKTKSNFLFEMKAVYDQSIEFDSLAYTKFNTIEIKNFFKNSEKFNEFERTFNVKNDIFKYISGISCEIYYEKRNYIENYNQGTVDIVSDLFNSIGIELFKFNDNTKIYNFDLNICNPSNFIVSLGSNGFKRLSVIPSILKANRSDDLYKINDPDQFINDDDYSTFHDMYESELLIDNKIHYSYNDILPIVKNIYCKAKQRSYYLSNILFHNKVINPPDLYNGDHYSNFLVSNSSGNTKIHKTGYSSFVKSHPLLPIFLSSNDKGVLGVFSFSANCESSLYEFQIGGNSNETIVKTGFGYGRGGSNSNISQINSGNTNLNSTTAIGNNISNLVLKKDVSSKQRLIYNIKFNPFGNEFMTIDNDKSLSIFDFNIYKQSPKFTLSSSSISSGLASSSYISNIKVSDASFLGYSGLLSTCNINNENYNSDKNLSFWDLILPTNKCKAGEVPSCGGNLLYSLKDEPSIVVGNNGVGNISFVDRRKNQILHSFKAFDNEIRSISISDSNKFLASSSKDGQVKIWDISNKSDPYVIESIIPFKKLINSNNVELNFHNDCLYVKGANSIKLLRNNMS